MRLRILATGLALAALASPSLYAQTGPAPREAGRIQVPVAGRMSMIGVRLSDVTAETMKTLKLSRMEGAVVESVNPNSPAATAGFHEKDVIVMFDGERVRSAGQLTRLVGETPAGREVSVSLMRGGQKTDLRITPESGSWFDPRFGSIINSDELRDQVEKAGRAAAREVERSLPDVMADAREGMGLPNRATLGVNVQAVNGELAGYFGVKSGVLVASVVPDSAAAKAGLKAGDVITAVNGKVIATPRELVSALPSGEGSNEVTLAVMRDKKETTLKATLTPPASADRPARGRRV